MSTPALPAGYQLDAQSSTAPPLPAGYKLDSASAEAKPSALSRFGTSFLSGLGITSNEDAKKFFLHPIQTAIDMAQGQGELAVKAKDAFKRGDYMSAVVHGLNYLVPMIGQQTDQAGEQLSSGDIAGGVGRTLGTAVPIAAASPEVRTAVKGATAPIANAASRAVLLGRTPEEAYQSAMKPSTTIPPEKVSGMVQTGLAEKIPVNEAGVERLSSLIDDYNAKIKAEIGTGQGKTVDPYAVASRLNAPAQKFATQVNPEADLAAVSDAGNEFLRNNSQPIPAADAQAMKQGTYRTLGAKAFGEVKTASIEAQKALARGIKEELANQFPELNGLNAAEGRLLDLQPVLEKAVQRISNHQLIGIGTPIAAGAAKAVTGSTTIGAVAGLLKAVLDDPSVKSRLAIRLSKGANIPYAQANANVIAFRNAVAQGVSANEQDQSQP